MSAGTPRSFDLTGRRALVTGGGSGLGFAIARGLAEAGAGVVINGRQRGRLETAAAELAREGYRVEVAPFDVTQAAAVAAAVAALEREAPIDILVNNAAINKRGPLDSFSDDDWRALMAANLDGPFFVARAVIPGMKTRGRGKIINLCSLASDIGRPNIVPYATSKGGMRMLTRALAVELAPHNIQRAAGCGRGVLGLGRAPHACGPLGRALRDCGRRRFSGVFRRRLRHGASVGGGRRLRGGLLAGRCGFIRTRRRPNEFGPTGSD